MDSAWNGLEDAPIRVKILRAGGYRDMAIERTHDFIQWLFTLPEPSAAIPESPVLTPEAALHLSLPKEQMFAWSWREANEWPSARAVESQVLYENGRFLPATELDEQDIKAFQTTAFFPKRFVLREGQLVLQHRADNSTEDSN